MKLVQVGFGGRDYGIAVQWNGERIRFERWVIEAFLNAQLRDPDLRRPLDQAVRIEIEW